MSDRDLARITVTRYLSDEGRDIVAIDSDDLAGGRVPVLEALGMLQIAIHDVLQSPEEP